MVSSQGEEQIEMIDPKNAKAKWRGGFLPRPS
jgi:hypothetical protein